MKIFSAIFIVVLLVALVWFVVRSLIDLIKAIKHKKFVKELKKADNENDRYHFSEKCDK